MCYTVAVLSSYIHSVTKVPYLSPGINKISLEESVRPISLMNSKVSKGKVTVHLFGTVFRVLIQCLRNASSPVTFLTPKGIDGMVISWTKEACYPFSAADQARDEVTPVSPFQRWGTLGFTSLACTKWESHGVGGVGYKLYSQH